MLLSRDRRRSSLSLALARFADDERVRSRSATCRSSTRKRRRRGSTASTTGRGNSSSAAAARRSTATARASPRVFLAGGKNRAKLFVNKSTRGGPLQVRGEAARHRRRSQAARQRHRRLSDRHRRRRPHGSVRAAGRRESAAEGRARLHVHARQQGMGLRRRRRLDDVVRRRMGEGAEVPDPRDRPLRRPRRAGLAVGHLRGQFAVSARSRATSRTIRCARRWPPASARCRCCSPTGTARACPRCASPTIANITAAAKSRCGGSSPASRPSSTGAPTAGGMCRSSAWASPRATSTAPAIPNMR